MERPAQQVSMSITLPRYWQTVQEELELRLYHCNCCTEFTMAYRSSAERAGRP